MAKNGFNWYNGAYEPNEFELAERQLPTDGFTYSNGKPITGILGYEAALDRELDRQEALASIKRKAKA
jgi:hypothetical protein